MKKDWDDIYDVIENDWDDNSGARANLSDSYGSWPGYSAFLKKGNGDAASLGVG